MEKPTKTQLDFLKKALDYVKSNWEDFICNEFPLAFDYDDKEMIRQDYNKTLDFLYPSKMENK